ncbi:MAG TPA: NUDIX hydrolase [Terriglobales bacterium]|jgi:mutator protein MutT|nr:NUDIX hydrolase [Terriglobales bacterium]
MKRDYPERPLVGVGAVIVSQGRVVIVQRSAEPLKGQWSIPGGALEIGETLRQCAAREALEETGLQVEAVDVLDVFDSIYADPDGRTRYHYVLIDFFCRVLGGELKVGSDAAQARWISRDELANFNIAETAQKVIMKALDRH